MSRHSQPSRGGGWREDRHPAGRHRARRPPANKAPAIIASAIVGATAAGFSTAAASGQGIAAMAVNAVALQAPVAQQALGIGGPDQLPAGIAAEDPMAGRQLLAVAEAHNRLADIGASRAASRRMLLLAEAARPKWALPMRPGSYVISSCFCARWGTFHYGVDLAAPWGTPFYAAGDGVVIEAGPMSGYGNVIMIQHADGDVSVYGHEEKVLVDIGERVRAGQLIGLVGALGEATGPHLHFEVRIGGEGGTKVDPVPWMAARGFTV